MAEEDVVETPQRWTARRRAALVGATTACAGAGQAVRRIKAQWGAVGQL